MGTATVSVGAFVELPFQTHEQVENAIEKCAGRAYCQALVRSPLLRAISVVRHLFSFIFQMESLASVWGGTTAASAVKAYVNRLLSGNIKADYSFAGYKGNKSFMSTPFYGMVLGKYINLINIPFHRFDF